MVISEVIKILEEKLKDRNKVYTLVEFVTGFSRNYFICHSFEYVDNSKVDKLLELVDKVKQGTPIQYITREQYFYGYKFYVDENVLIPQPDTEILVEKCIENVQNGAKILDMCTGSGCIAIALKKKLQNAKVYALDISREALNVAKKNAIMNDAEIEFIESNMFENLLEKDFDVIISNPPYIRKGEINSLPTEVKNEPILALDGGDDGLKFYRELAVNSKKFLKNGGKLFLEIGYDQKEEVKVILQNECYSDIKVYKDYGDNFRVIEATN
ncbi:MAG: peptide chain release factor N(5)-glutamine methyltransferase [Clostridia bacterium]|nr:peptide chain release factor N(5)-glutamine methyltransferase [Clostridia bacterium]